MEPATSAAPYFGGRPNLPVLRLQAPRSNAPTSLVVALVLVMLRAPAVHLCWSFAVRCQASRPPCGVVEPLSEVRRAEAGVVARLLTLRDPPRLERPHLGGHIASLHANAAS